MSSCNGETRENLGSASASSSRKRTLHRREADEAQARNSESELAKPQHTSSAFLRSPTTEETIAVGGLPRALQRVTTSTTSEEQQAASVRKWLEEDPVATQARARVVAAIEAMELETGDGDVLVPETQIFQTTLPDILLTRQGRVLDIDSEPETEEKPEPGNLRILDEFLALKVPVDRESVASLDENRFERVLRQEGLTGLVLECIEDEVKSANTLNDAYTRRLLVSGYALFCSIPGPLLRGLLSGNLAAACARDPDVSRVIDVLSKRMAVQPCLYALMMTDKKGRPMTYHQAELLASTMLKYAEGASLEEFGAQASAIDTIRPGPRQWKKEYSMKGRRKYLEVKTSDGRYAFSEARAHEYVKLASGILREVGRQLPEQRSERMRHAFIYNGFSSNGRQRRKDHAEHRGSSYCAYGVEATTLVLFNGEFELRFLPVALLGGPEQAIPGEILLSRLTQGYTDSGYSLAHYPAGRSNSSALNLNELQWQTARDFILEYTPFRSNHNRELVEQHRKLEAETVELERLKQHRRGLEARPASAPPRFSLEQQQYLDGERAKIRDADEELKRLEAVAARERLRFVEILEECVKVVKDALKLQSLAQG